MKHFFVTHKNPVAVIAVLIIAGGLFAYSKMQTSLFPEITFPKIKVIADAGDQPASQMMVTVTRQLENAIRRVPGLRMLRSTTSRGSCEISAFLDWTSDINVSQQRIESRISQIRELLPLSTRITVERMNPSILPVMGYTLEAPGMSPVDQKILALYTIKPFLSQVEGVSEIRVIGGKSKEYWLTLNVGKMSMLGITPAAVRTALGNTNFIQSNGFLADHRQLYLSLTDARVRNNGQLENLVISNNGKRIVRLKDIATLTIEEAKEYIKINSDGKEALLLAVVKQPGANLIDLSDHIEKQVAALKDILPAGVRVRPYYIQSDFVQDSIKSVSDSLWIGLALAIVVAILFLRSLKASLVILITIPVTLLLTLIILYATGETFNIMTLGALAAAIGLIIDDAIVVVEQIHRTHEENPGLPSTSLVHKAIHYLLPAMVGSSLSTIVIFLPFVLMTGVAGAYFKVMTNTMIITLVCSFFVTWLCLPVIYLLLTREKATGNKAAGKPPKSAGKRRRSHRWLTVFLKRPYITFLIMALLAGSIFYVYPRLESGFLPEMDEGSIVLDYESPPGTSLDETDRMLREVEKIITAIPEVKAYSRRTGTQMGFFITEPNRGDYLIQLKKKRSRTTDEVIDDIRNRVEATQPALRIDFGQVIGDMLGDLMTSVQPIEIKIFGNDQKQLNQLSKQIAALIDTIPGTADVFDGIVIAGPSVSVIPDAAGLAQYGLTPADFQYQLRTAMEGNVVGSVLDAEQETPIRIVYPGSKKADIEDIRKLSLFLPDGRVVPITNLASIRLNAGEAEIERQDLQSMGVVTARLNNRDLGSVMNEIQRNVTQSIRLPKGYHIVYGGAYADQQRSFRELLMILISSCLLVFGVILFLFRKFNVALMILLIAILGISGCYWALYLTHTPLNVGSYTGLIMIVGIIGENAIFTYQQFSNLLQESGNPEEAIRFAISTRLRPKLMTALGAIVALMPIALGIGTGAQLHQPLAIAVIGGFVVALPLLLIVFPGMLYLVFKRSGHSSSNS